MPRKHPSLCSDREREKFFRACEKYLLSEINWKPIKLSLEWEREFAEDGGVYAAFESRRLVYVGEAQSIQKRMHNLRKTQNHVLRRNLGDHHFAGQSGYQKATTKREFPPRIEEKVIHFLTTRFKISVLPVSIGRKELEEWLIMKHNPRYNKKSKKKGE